MTDVWGVAGVREFWNARAADTATAGTRDHIAKHLEIEVLCSYLKPGQRILDVGCGTGVLALEMARRAAVEVVGIDTAEECIAVAKRSVEFGDRAAFRGLLPRFEVADVMTLPGRLGNFDLVITERTLINLPDWSAQARAVDLIGMRVARGGLYLMLENTQDGLDRLNVLRDRVKLPIIVPPWHNRYFRESEIGQLSLSLAPFNVVDVRDYSATYYFLSRVVNAALARDRREEPDYDSPINRLALSLPGDLSGDVGLGCGQGLLWVWKQQRSLS